MEMIKEECGSSGPKNVLAKISMKVGGVLSASDACELPRDEQQVSQVKRRLKYKSRSLGGQMQIMADDGLSVVMQRAFMEDTSKQFVREMKTLREPAIVVGLDRQLDDLVRFCTEKEKFGILSVDPTFSLGVFNVTVVSYRHLLLQSRRSDNPPVFIGPVMVHYKKSFATYLFFATTLVGLRPQLKNLRCFGTDREEALFEAFQRAFPSSIHLTCWIHMRRNILAKVQELGISQSTKQVIVADLFGKQVGTHYIEGLVDAREKAQYSEGFAKLSKKWESLDASKSGPVHDFVQWYSQYKSTIIQTTMLQSIRKEAGFGDPPELFSTNASESMNAVLKNKVYYKKSELPEFLEKLKEVINEQEREKLRGQLSTVVNTGYSRVPII